MENQKKSVFLYNLSDGQSAIYESLSAASKASGIQVKEISSVCHNKTPISYNGYVFRFYKGQDIDLLKKEIITYREWLKSRTDELPETRVCSSCKKELPLTTEYFQKGRQGKYKKASFKYVCKQCRKVEHGASYARKKVEIESNSTLKADAIIKIYAKIDKKRGLAFDLTTEWVLENIVNAICFYCGFPSNGIDRKDNSRGHEKSNCIPCCKECNNARMDNFTHEEFIIIGKAISQIKRNRISHDTIKKTIP